MTYPDTLHGKQVVTLAYPSGSGGNYIAALCGLSKHSNFRHGLMSNLFTTSQEKYLYLKKYLQCYRNPWWEDFDFGNDKMWLLDLREFAQLVEFMHKGQPLNVYQWLMARSPCAKTFYQPGNKKFFWVSHSPYDTQLILNCWSESSIVIMINNQAWLQKRMNSTASDLWKPEDYEAIARGRSHFFFDIGSMLAVDSFCCEMQRLYAWLGFTDFQVDWIKDLHPFYLELIEFLLQVSKKTRLVVAGTGSSIALVC